MSRRTLPFVARVAGWLTVPLYLAGTCTNYLLTLRAGSWSEANPVENAQSVVLNIGFGAFAVVGALLVAKRPTNPIGWILALVALMVAISNAGGVYAAYLVATRGQPDALAVFGAWTQNWYWYLFLGLALLYLPLLFPDGRLVSRRWLPVAVLAGIATLGTVLLNALVDTLPVVETPGYRIDNPVGIEGLGEVEDLPIFGVLNGMFLLAGLGAVASVVVRFRRSRGIERQQMKVFAYVTVVLLGGAVLTGGLSDATGAPWLGEISFVLSMVGFVSLPIAVGIAILRYRLYDIDLVINRTLVYGPVSAMLVLVYLGGLVSLQYALRAFTGQESQLAVVASTLAIAALFNPLRRRVQAFVDLHFYRRRYDARKVLAAFNARLREETDIEVLSKDLVGVARDTLQPEHVSLSLRPETVSKDERVD